MDKVEAFAACSGLKLGVPGYEGQSICKSLSQDNRGCQMNGAVGSASPLHFAVADHAFDALVDRFSGSCDHGHGLAMLGHNHSIAGSDLATCFVRDNPIDLYS